MPEIDALAPNSGDSTKKQAKKSGGNVYALRRELLASALSQYEAMGDTERAEEVRRALGSNR